MLMNATTARDGSAVVLVDGATQKIIGEDLADVRRKVLAAARARAAHDGHQVTLVSSDPDGVWTVIVTPDGGVHDPANPPAVAAAAPQPAPAPRRRRRGRSAAVPDVPVRPAFSPPAAPPSTTTWSPAELPVDVDVTVRAAARPFVPSVTLTFDSGQRIRITGTAFVGRRPANTSSIPAELHAVVDESRNLSRTHFLIAWNGGRVGLLDQDSANGTVIERDGAEPIAAQPGYAAILQDGDRLRFGDTTATVAIATAP